MPEAFARTARDGLDRMAAPWPPAYFRRVTGTRTTARRASQLAKPAAISPGAALAVRVYRWLLPAVIAAITIAAFLPVLGDGFVDWDDDKNFVNNPHFRGLGAEQLHWMWTTFLMGHYIPLSWMTLGLDHQLWGMNPAGYHLTSLLLHAANAVAVFALLRLLLSLANPETAEGQPASIAMAAGIGALIFAVHPLRVESVAWVTERRDVLSGLFFFMSIFEYVRSRVAPPSDERRGYLISLVLFVCALLSKATSMTLPAVLLVINAYPLRRIGGDAGWWSAAAKRVYLELVPFALLALAVAVLSIVALHPPTQLGAGAKIAVSAYSLVFYLWKEVAPVHLSPLYEMPQHVSPTDPRFVASYFFVAALAAALWISARKRWGAVASVIAFVVISLPMLGAVQNGPQIAADRYAYHAAPAIAALFAAGALWLLSRGRALTLGLSFIVVLALSALTWQQAEVWHNSETLWQQVLDVDPNSSIAHSSMANVRYKQNRVQEGVEHSERAVAINPTYAEGYNGLGVGLAREGRVPDAIVAYERALSLQPKFDEAQTNLGVSLAQQGDLAAAIEHYQRAIAENPDNGNAHVNWGNALVRLERPAEAVEHYAAAVRIRPDNSDAQLNWGVALAREGRFADAIEHFRAALAIDPNNADARGYLVRATQLLDAPRQRRPNT
jgi:tetratricopeptide (TPR) repeat protein